MTTEELFSKSGDAVDFLANRGKLYIDIYHVNSEQSLQFKAFLTNFQDTFSPTYDEEYFIMHPEPIRKWRSTVRQISLTFNTVASGRVEAENNLAKISLLTQMLYGEQEKDRGGFVPKVGGSPIFKIKFANLITSQKEKGQHFHNAKTVGLSGYITDFNYTMKMDEGFFGAGPSEVGKVFPQTMEVSLTYAPVHEKSPAWIESDAPGKAASTPEFRYPTFPYGDTYSGGSPYGKQAPSAQSLGTGARAPGGSRSRKIAGNFAGKVTKP